jgi:acyl-homoserine lactone acylase PvdQ
MGPPMNLNSRVKMMFERLLRARFYSRQQKLIRLRGEVTAQSFSAMFTDERERMVARMVWDHLRREAVVPDFRPHPDDRLLTVYGIAEEELDEDLILQVLRDLGAPTPRQASADAFGRSIPCGRRYGSLPSRIEIGQRIRVRLDHAP